MMVFEMHVFLNLQVLEMPCLYITMRDIYAIENIQDRPIVYTLNVYVKIGLTKNTCKQTDGEHFTVRISGNEWFGKGSNH